MFKHNYGGEYENLGENIYKGSADPENAVMTWWLEGENYKISDKSCDKKRKYTRYSTCGHYLQVARGLLKTLGCARKECPDSSHLIFCEYNRKYVFYSEFDLAQFF